MGVISLLVVLYGVLKRSSLEKALISADAGIVYSIAIGLIFAVSVIYTMLDPIELSEGAAFDVRCLFVGVATGLFGPLVGLVPLIAGSLLRISVGGPGIAPGLFALALSFGGGLIWRTYVRDAFAGLIGRGTSLGFCLSIHIFAILTLAEDIWEDRLVSLTVFYLTNNIFGATLIYGLLRREDTLLDQFSNLEKSAHHDALTGLVNRRKMETLYVQPRARRTRDRGTGIICFDLDGFKSVNDRYGHDVGDQALILVAEKALKEVRSNDHVCRLGGDEFLILLQDVEAATVKNIAERCRSAIRDHRFMAGDMPVQLSISAGAIWKPTRASFRKDYRIADRALYKAKDDGGNTVYISKMEDGIMRY